MYTALIVPQHSLAKSKIKKNALYNKMFQKNKQKKRVDARITTSVKLITKTYPNIVDKEKIEAKTVKVWI